jgi:hypothetical protein
MSGIDQIGAIQDWYASAANHVGLNEHMRSLAKGILDIQSLIQPPNISWFDAGTIKVIAGDAAVGCLLCGFPDMKHPGQWIDAGLTDRRCRAIAAQTSLSCSIANASSTMWGSSEKASQWYAIYAIAAAADLAFTLKAMPLLRFSSQAGQVITLRNNLNTADIGYGFSTNEFVGGKIYVLSGTSMGMLRDISANNNDNTTLGTITYTGAALTMTQGDWFVILPPTAIKFRWLGNVLNNAGSAIPKFLKQGNQVTSLDAQDAVVSATGASGIKDNAKSLDPLASSMLIRIAYYNSALNSTSARCAHPDYVNGAVAISAYEGLNTNYYYDGSSVVPVARAQFYSVMPAYSGGLSALILGWWYPVGY